MLTVIFFASVPVFADDSSKTPASEATADRVAIGTVIPEATRTDAQIHRIDKKIGKIDREKDSIDTHQEKLENSKEKAEISNIKGGFDELKLTVSEKITWAQIKKLRADKHKLQASLLSAKSNDEKASISAKIGENKAKDAWLAAKIKSVDAKMLEDKDDINREQVKIKKIDIKQKGLDSDNKDLNNAKEDLEAKKAN
jgi:chromosome segregation ATPase